MTEAVADEKKEPRKIHVEYGGKGDKLTLPEGMNCDEAIEALHRIRDEEETEVNVSELVRAFPLDGAVAFQKALKERFNWSTLVPTRGMWGNKIHPKMIGVEIAYDETIQIPWGKCQVPKIEGTFNTGFDLEDEMPIFQVGATVKRRWEKTVAEIAKRTREIVATDSIYRGQAIKVNFRDSDGDRKSFDPSFAPKFMKLEPKHVVYSTETEKLIQNNLFNPVQHTDKCRRERIPLKRGILLEGRYGTGKTLTANLLASLCVKNGWTFLYLADVRDIDLAMAFAKMYQPCVLFAEDVDKAVGPSRTDDVNRILNTLDGVESKNVEIMTVFTTNNVNGIHSAFLRPGRVDTVIPIYPPDEKAVLNLLRHYGQNSDGVATIEGSDDELLKAARLLRKTNASFVQEAVERAKLGAIAKSNGKLVIGPEDIEVAAQSMQQHMKLVCPESGATDDLFDGEEIDPARLAIDLLTQQFAEAMIDQIANPKVLMKVIKKNMKGGPRPPFSQN